MEKLVENNNDLVLRSFIALGEFLKDSKFADVQDESDVEHLDIVKKYLCVNDNEAKIFCALLTISYLPDLRGYIGIGKIAEFFGISPLQVLLHKECFEVLVQKQLIKQEEYCGTDETDVAFSCVRYSIYKSITENIIKNSALDTSSVQVTDCYSFFKSAANCNKNRKLGKSVGFSQSVEKLEDENTSLSFIANLQNLVSHIYNRILFYKACDAFFSYGSYTTIDTLLGDLYEETKTRLAIGSSLKNGTNDLIINDFITLENDSFFNSIEVVLTDYAFTFLLGEEAVQFIKPPSTKNIIKLDTLREKSLFFDTELQKQIDFIKNSLSEDSYKRLVERLQQKSLNKGVAALFYGSAGTGKTESVYQIAKPTPTIQSKIWQNKFPFLSSEQSQNLAHNFAFSGGEIDNVLRKLTIDEVISGTEPHYNTLETFCAQEKLGEKGSKIGFCG